MNYYVYKITNTKNDEYYIGRRQCECNISEDDYMGSGVKINKRINELGIENFDKQILAVCSNFFELEIVEGAYISANKLNKDCLNAHSGRFITDEKLIEENKKIRNDNKRLSKDISNYMQENTRLSLDYKEYYEKLEELRDRIDDLYRLNKVKTDEIKEYKKGINKESKKLIDKKKELKSYIKIYEDNKEIIEQLKTNNLHEDIRKLLNIDSKNKISKGDIVRLGSDDCLYFVRNVNDDHVELVFNLCKNSSFEQTQTITYDELNKLSFYKINTN